MFPFGSDDAQKFEDNLAYLEKVEYKTGYSRGGFETRTYMITKDRVEREILRIPGPIVNDDAYTVSSPYTREEFIQGLKGFKIGKWKKEYDNPMVLDGTYWDLTFYYKGDIPSVRYTGSNAHPKNYRAFKKFMQRGEEEK